MSEAAAGRYVARLHLERLGAFLTCLGLLLAAAGFVGGPLVLVVGIASFAAALLWAWAEALRMRVDGQPLFGPSSTASEANRLTGWWYLDEACEVLGRDAAKLRSRLRLAVVATVLAFVAAPITAVLAH